jgi:glycosyltransferase involved in cell wall biosynthesis
VKGESAEIVAGADAGLVTRPESPAEMADAIRRLRSDPELSRKLGRNGRAAAEGEFCRSSAARRMMGVLERTVGHRRGAR